MWDRLDIQLSDRAIERDIRIVQQRVVALSAMGSLHVSQDDSQGTSAHYPSRRGPTRSWAVSDATVPFAVPAHGTAASDSVHAADPTSELQHRSRSSSPSFQFPPAAPVTATAAAPQAPQAAVAAAQAPTAGLAPLLPGTGAVGWDGCGLQHQQQQQAQQAMQYVA